MTADDPSQPSDGVDANVSDGGCEGDTCSPTVGPDSETPGEDAGQQYRLSVPDMDCPSCAGKVEKALSDVDSLDDVQTQPTSGSVLVTRTTGSDDENIDDVVDAVEGAGYRVERVDGSGSGGASIEIGQSESLWSGRRGISTWVSGLFLFAGLVVTFALGGLNVTVPLPVVEPIATGHLLMLGGVVAGGWIIVRNGYYSARSLSLDIDLLMSSPSSRRRACPSLPRASTSMSKQRRLRSFSTSPNSSSDIQSTAPGTRWRSC